MGRKAASDRDRTGLSRREFSRILAAGAASTALPRAAPAASDVTQPDRLPQTETPLALAEAEAQYRVLVNKYGARLSDEQKADVRRLIDQGLKSAVILRSFQLDNADEPANVFQARLRR